MNSKIKSSVKAVFFICLFLFGSSFSLRDFLHDHLPVSHYQIISAKASDQDVSFIIEMDQVQAESSAGSYAEVPGTSGGILPELKSDTRGELRLKQLSIYFVCNINNIPINIFDRNQKIVNTVELSSAPAANGSLGFCLRV